MLPSEIQLKRNSFLFFFFVLQFFRCLVDTPELQTRYPHCVCTPWVTTFLSLPSTKKNLPFGFIYTYFFFSIIFPECFSLLALPFVCTHKRSINISQVSVTQTQMKTPVITLQCQKEGKKNKMTYLICVCVLKTRQKKNVNQPRVKKKKKSILSIEKEKKGDY